MGQVGSHSTMEASPELMVLVIGVITNDPANKIKVPITMDNRMGMRVKLQVAKIIMPIRRAKRRSLTKTRPFRIKNNRRRILMML